MMARVDGDADFLTAVREYLVTTGKLAPEELPAFESAILAALRVSEPARTDQPAPRSAE